MQDRDIPLTALLVRCVTTQPCSTLRRDIPVGTVVYARTTRPGRYDLYDERQQLLVCDCPGRRLRKADESTGSTATETDQ